MNKRIFIILALIIILLSPPCATTAAAPPVADRYEQFGFQIPEKGCALFIDLDICTMIVYRDGRIYSAYPVSGGTAANPSPTGSWRVSGISRWGEGFGGSWIGLNVPWGKYGIHGTVQPWALGETNVSHGCIRMRDEDVGVVRSLVSVGTVVYIKNDTLPFRAMKNGMIGSDILRTQKMLYSLGFYTGARNGVFGNGTERAVRGFQKTYSLHQDGIVGRETERKIREQYHLKSTLGTCRKGLTSRQTLSDISPCL